MKTSKAQIWFSIAIVMVLCIGGLPLPAQAETTLLQAPSEIEAQWVTIMTEGFEGTWPAGLWSAYDGNGAYGGEVFWDEDDWKPHTGTKSAWCANEGANGRDPQYYDYPNDMDAWAIYGPFDLSDATQAELKFWVWNASEPGYDYFKWLASKDCVNYYGYVMSIPTTGWDQWTMNLANVPTIGNLTGDPSVCIAFKFTSDYGITNDGAFVDDVELRKYVSVTQPDLVTSPPSPSSAAPYDVGEAVTWSVTTTNQGNAQAGASTLGYYLGTSCSDLSRRIAEDSVGALAAGASEQDNAAYTFLAGDVGTRYLVSKADYLNVVGESNENNNTNCYGPFQVQQPAEPCYELALDVWDGSGAPPTAAPPNSSGCPAGQYHAGQVITLTPNPAQYWALHFYYAEPGGYFSAPTYTMPAEDATVWAWYESAAGITVVGGIADVSLGGGALIQFRLWNYGASKIGSITLDVEYDDALVVPAGCDADPGNLFDSALCNANYLPGVVRLTALSSSGVAGHPLLADITFVALNPFTDTELDETVAVLTDPAGVALPSSTVNGWLVYDAAGRASGDVNCSGGLDVMDPTYVLQREVGMRYDINVCPPDPAYEIFRPACDVTADTKCNVTDALWIAQCVSGYANPLCPVLGEPRGSGRPTMPAGVGFGAGRGTDGLTTLPILLSLGQQPLGAATVEIQLDPAGYQVEGCTADPAGVLDAAVCHYDAATGQVVLTGYATAGVSGDLVLGEVTYRLLDPAASFMAPLVTAPVLVDPAGRPIEGNIF